MPKKTKLTETAQFDVFNEQYMRLFALYMEMANGTYKPELVQLSREIVLFQLIATVEVYQTDSTREILVHQMKHMNKYRKPLLKVFAATAHSTWDEVYAELLSAGVEHWAHGNLVIWIDNMIKHNIIPKPATSSRTEWLQLDELKSTRNLFAHCKGIVDDGYRKRTQEYYNAVGMPIPSIGDERLITPQYCYDSFQCCNKVMKSIDETIISVIT